MDATRSASFHADLGPGSERFPPADRQKHEKTASAFSGSANITTTKQKGVFIYLETPLQEMKLWRRSEIPVHGAQA